MNTMPMNWIHQIHYTLQEMQEIPLWGNPPPIPWDQCIQEVASLLQTPELSLVVGDTQLLPKGKVLLGIGNHPIVTSMQLSPLVGQCFWVMAQEDITFLISLALTENQNQKTINSASLQEGFYRFLILETLKAFDPLKPFSDLSLKMGSLTTILPQENCICMDIGIHHPKKVLWGRIICPTDFHQAFKTHFANTALSIYESNLAKDINLAISAQIGYTQLTLSQWKKIAAGDFLILDVCSYSPHTAKGTATLFLEQTPLFTVICKPTNCKIIDYAYQEESMDEDFEEEDMNEEKTTQELEEPLISVPDALLTIHVEIARMRMNLKKLTQLKPGNVIELAIRPEQGVKLTLSGKAVAKGELIQLGDVLGVKILQIGE
ncbi:type III secretion system cytoplasmic ring protein SctQ [Candidatus Rhabdochlamydia porcellionis]|uniref:Type III flagellar switch regulator (C-ring) FliN C-term n=1 Tax=Candidatus Rhabdochlamydia porcellionis TaxID=225148 RepID=A0ABX8YYM1_9BACT|nr:type III secretion system cytoplasmic ring protein SctQ [Candidatus Rhabdochlamydia porcellionis]QZA58369.1 Type III flagellar switch regulator (C-ring) FliN C-term [Candidatus Rhabdochlamydia porcellionis]